MLKHIIQNHFLSMPEASELGLAILRSQEYCFEMNSAGFFCFLFQIIKS